jgi:hypothetical protein
MKHKSISATTELLASLARLSIVTVGSIAILVTAPVASASVLTFTGFVYSNGAAGNLGTDTSSVFTNTMTNTGTITLTDNFTNNGIPLYGDLQAQFSTVASANPTDYSVTKTVINETGVTWTDFEIGVGFAGNGTTAIASCLSCGSGIVGEYLNPFEILWPSLNIPTGTSVTFTFGFDTCAGCSVFFGIDEYPSTGTAPEPGSMILGGIGLALTCAARFRKGWN